MATKIMVRSNYSKNQIKPVEKVEKEIVILEDSKSDAIEKVAKEVRDKLNFGFRKMTIKVFWSK